MSLITQALIQEALRMPQDHIEHCAAVYEIIKDRMAVKGEYMSYLFEAYNEFCALTESRKQDIDCGHCRSKMLWRYNQFIQIWEANGKLEKSESQ